jgi:hypothetical protein
VSLLPTGAMVIQSYTFAGPFATDTVNVALSATENAPLVPFTVSVGPAPPVVTVNATAEEVPPPGDGVKTVMFLDPVVATSAAEIDAVNDVLDTNVVVRAAPLIWICELEVKPVPVAVSTKAVFAAIDAGEMLFSTGTGADGTLPTVIAPLVARRMYLPLPRKRTS